MKMYCECKGYFIIVSRCGLCVCSRMKDTLLVVCESGKKFDQFSRENERKV